jgi:hypothetical protein
MIPPRGSQASTDGGEGAAGRVAHDGLTLKREPLCGAHIAQGIRPIFIGSDEGGGVPKFAEAY